MRKTTITLKLTGLFVLTVLAAAAQTRFLIETSNGADALRVATQHGLTYVKALSDSGQPVHLLSAPAGASASQLATQLKSDPQVVQAEPDTRITPSAKATKISQANLNVIAAASADKTLVNFHGSMVRRSYVTQYAVGLTELSAAQTLAGFGTGTVAIIDSGIDATHPALSSVVVPGYDFIQNRAGVPDELAILTQSVVGILDQSVVGILDQSVVGILDQSVVGILDQSVVGILDQSVVGILDQSVVGILDQSVVGILDAAGKLPSHFGHGTENAGLIHLMAPNARLMPLRAFQFDGTGQLSDIVHAIYYAVDHGAKVINMSFNLDTPSPSLVKAVQYAASKNVLMIAAAGNSGQEVLVYPAGLPGVIGVGSTSPTDVRSSFSNYGVRSASFAAPGEGLITTYPGNHYAAVWGTSFSTPLVSGATSLFLDMKPNLRAEDLREALEHGTRIPNQELGDARLDASKSLMYLVGNNH